MADIPDTSALVKLIEDAIYEVALAVIFLPRSLLLALQPARLHTYVSEELAKPVEQRYSRGLSPIVFWIVVAVLPMFLAPLLFLNTQVRFRQEPGTRFFADAILLSTFPLCFSIMASLVCGRTISRESFRRIFYIECFSWAPVYFCVALLGSAMPNIKFKTFGLVDQHVVEKVLGAALILVILWQLYLQVKLLRIESEAPYLRAVAACFLAFAVGIGVYVTFMRLNTLFMYATRPAITDQELHSRGTVTPH